MPDPINKRLDSIPMRNRDIIKLSNKSLYKANDIIKNKSKKVKKYSVPNSTDSLAVYMNNDAAKSGFKSNWSDISDAAQKKYGKINVSKYNIKKSSGHNAQQARKKYGL